MGLTQLRVLLPMEMAKAAETKATAEGRTVADVVSELLSAYLRDKAKPKRTRKRQTVKPQD